MSRNLGSGKKSRTELSSEVMSEIRKAESENTIEAEDLTTVSQIDSPKLFNFLEGDDFEVTLDDEKKRINILINGVELGYFKTSPKGRERLVLLLTDLYDYALERDNLEAIRQLRPEYAVLDINIAELPIIKNEVGQYLQGIEGFGSYEDIIDRNPLTEQQKSEIRKNRTDARREQQERAGQVRIAEGEVVQEGRLATQEAEFGALHILSNDFKISQHRLRQIMKQSDGLLETVASHGWSDSIAAKQPDIKNEFIRALADLYMMADNIDLNRRIFSPEHVKVFDANAKAIFKSLGLEPRGFIFKKLENDRQFQHAINSSVVLKMITSGYSENEMKKAIRKMTKGNPSWRKVYNAALQQAKEDPVNSRKILASSFLVMRSDDLSDSEFLSLAQSIPALEDEIRIFRESSGAINPFSDLLKYNEVVGGSTVNILDESDASGTAGVSKKVTADGKFRENIDLAEVSGTQVIQTYLQAEAEMQQNNHPYGVEGEIMRTSLALIDYVLVNADKPAVLKEVYNKLGGGDSVEGKRKFLHIFEREFFDDNAKKAVSNTFFALKDRAVVNGSEESDGALLIQAFVSTLQNEFSNKMSAYSRRRSPSDRFFWTTDRKKVSDFFKTLGVGEMEVYIRNKVDVNTANRSPYGANTGRGIDKRGGMIDQWATRAAADAIASGNPALAKFYLGAGDFTRGTARFVRGSALGYGIIKVGKTLFSATGKVLTGKWGEVVPTLRDGILGKKVSDDGSSLKRNYTDGAALYLGGVAGYDALNGDVAISPFIKNLGIEAAAAAGFEDAELAKERRESRISTYTKSVEYKEIAENTYASSSLGDILSQGLVSYEGNKVSFDFTKATPEQLLERGWDTLSEAELKLLSEGQTKYLFDEYGLTSSTWERLTQEYNGLSVRAAMERYNSHYPRLQNALSLLPDSMVTQDDEHLIAYLDDASFESKIRQLGFAGQQNTKITDSTLLNSFMQGLSGPEKYLSMQPSEYLSKLSDVKLGGISAKEYIIDTLLPQLTTADVRDDTTVSSIIGGYFKVLYSVFGDYPETIIFPAATGGTPAEYIVTGIEQTPGGANNLPEDDAINAFSYGKVTNANDATQEIDLSNTSLASYFHDPAIGGSSSIPSATLGGKTAGGSLNYQGIGDISSIISASTFNHTVTPATTSATARSEISGL